MGASFRNTDEVLALAGCDYLTIGPHLLDQLDESNDPVERQLSAEAAQQSDMEKIHYDEKTFRYALGEDPCATAKLAEGIVRFAGDTEKLEALISEMLSTN